MLGRIAKTIRCATRRQFRIVNKFRDRSRKRLSVTWFNEQTVVAMLDDLWNIPYFRSDDGAAAGESFTQDDRRGFGAQRGNHYHVAGCINVRRVPAISRHNDLVGQSSLIYRVTVSYKNMTLPTNMES